MTSAVDMSEPIFFCERWNNKKSAPIGPLTPAQAQRRDVAKQWYTVVLGDLAAPRCFVEVAWENDHVGVWFLDDELRRYVHYSFARIDDQLMFMDAVVLWYYPDGAGRRFEDAEFIEDVEYTREGTVTRECTDVRTREVTTEHWSDVPLDINWERVPEFGDYRSLTRLDREPTDPGPLKMVP